MLFESVQAESQQHTKHVSFVSSAASALATDVRQCSFKAVKLDVSNCAGENSTTADENQTPLCSVSGFRHGVNKIFAVLGFYAA